MSFAIIESNRDRATAARRVLATLAIAIIGTGVAISELEHVAVPADAPPPMSEAGHRLVIPGDLFGQCHVAARVNGSLIRSLLLDSGASGRLTFGRNHAAQLGFDPAKLSYSYQYGSANGIGHEALVRVQEFRLDAGFVLRDVPAAITDASQSEPLLGIEILRRLNLRLGDGACEISWP